MVNKKAIKKLKNKFVKEIEENKIKYLVLLSLIPIFIILYKLYIPRVNAFGCFDDCNNFMRGYFVLKGNALFSEVFSGHQPLGSYLSTIIQYITQPQNIFELVLRHRQFMIIFAFLMNALIIFRFGAKFILFTVIYEFSKFYLFGDRFLGDGMIVYLLTYMLGLIFLKIKNEKIHVLDYILASIFTWFIVYMRAPYVPVAMITYLIFLWKWPLFPIKKEVILSVGVFTVISFITLFMHDVYEYFYNVVYFNTQTNLQAEAKPEMFGPWFLHWFFYPLYIFFYGPLNEFKYLLMGLNTIFLALFINLIWKRKFLVAGVIFLILGFSNIRTVLPGNIFYGSFHMLSWYALMIFISLELINYIKRKNYKLITYGLMIGIFLVFLLSPAYFGKDQVDTHQEFITHYGSYLQEGEVLKALASPGDTLFIDGSDDLIYWQSEIVPSYKYSWYTSSMHFLDRYSQERLKMFTESAPTFYREYGLCKKPENYKFDESYKIPDIVKNEYIRLELEGNPSCIYIKKEKLSDLTENQIQKIQEFKFGVPEEVLN